jgi:hypothetical protein
MKLAIQYKNRIYIKKKVSMSKIKDEINMMFDSIGLPINISIFNESMRDDNIVNCNKYRIDRAKRLNLPKPLMHFDEFILDKVKE